MLIIEARRSDVGVQKSDIKAQKSDVEARRSDVEGRRSDIEAQRSDVGVALYPKDTEGILLHDFIFAPFFCGSAGSGNTWHWDHYIEPNQLWYHFGRFKNAIEGIDPMAEAMQPFSFSSMNVNCYGLQGKTKTIL